MFILKKKTKMSQQLKEALWTKDFFFFLFVRCDTHQYKKKRKFLVFRFFLIIPNSFL